jgi:hypothetical protein
MEKALFIVLEQIKEKRDQIATAVSTSAAKDYAEYQKLCGEIRGLSIAEGFIYDLLKHMEQSND